MNKWINDKLTETNRQWVNMGSALQVKIHSLYFISAKEASFEMGAEMFIIRTSLEGLRLQNVSLLQT